MQNHIKFFALLVVVVGVAYATAVFAAPKPTLAQTQMGQLFPIAPSEHTIETEDISTTALDLFGTDLTSAQKVATVVQVVRITNRHASNVACVWEATWSGSDSCQTRCTATAKTCSGAAGDGAPYLPGTSQTIAVTGEACLCVVASAASTTVTKERIVRDM